MLELIGIQYLTTALYAMTALVLVLGLLRWLDKSAGRPWGDVIDIIREDPHAAALYYGVRFAGACLLVGLVMSS
ncbi:hypothetical protein [Pseudodesulfovibrio tunisiensis]|uniref:hypothetical protein n=1 Tax=Pseudodesulfovibrio tunisiensis TaxID=463192 RepID=UPI001FB5366A|nr:hypothetical protein [Pseudodesulfovibrio tunisiensis]